MKGVTIELDIPRKIRYDFNAIADVEERAGLGISALVSGDKVGFHTLRLLLWGGLKWANKRLTIDNVGEYLQAYLTNGGDLAALGEKITEALIDSGIIAKAADDTEGNVEGEEN